MDDKTFRFFFDQAMGRELPVVYAVIPGKMDKELIRFLRRTKEKTPHLLDLVQHGWTHANYSTNGSKYEFGKSRSLQLQRRDIKQGLKQMRSAFGDCFTPAFVPPYHGFDERTLQVLEEEDFRAFSVGNHRLQKRFSFIEFPARVSFSCYDKKETYTTTAAGMVEMLSKDIKRRPLSGVLTHHADFKTAAARKELTRFFDLIQKLRDKKELQVVLFSDLLRKKSHD
jgi:predicted deacetylase